MRTIINRTYELEVAHRLSAGIPEGHKCGRMHGHRYIVTISVSGEVGADGMVLEYQVLDDIVWPILAKLDHYDANSLNHRCSTAEALDVSENPTVELMVRWLVLRIEPHVKHAVQDRYLRLERIVMGEDSRSSAEWDRTRCE